MGTILATNNLRGVDIASKAEMFSYLLAGSPTSAIGRMVVLTAGATGLVGGLYYPGIYVNDIQVYPVFPIAVPAGERGFIVEANANLIKTGETVSFSLQGQPGDIVDCKSDLINGLGITDEDIRRITCAAIESLRYVSLQPERVIFSPKPQRVKTFQLAR